jgi:Skp family chaperone for outer membrane proteins
MSVSSAALSRFARLAVMCAVACGVLLAASTASAQGGGQPAAGGIIPAGKIAIIDISAFPGRVTELKRKIDELNAKFEPRSKEVQGLRDSISGIENQVRQGNLTAAQSTQLSERYEQLKRDYTRKSEDLTAEARKAYAEATSPLNAKLSEALQRFASERGFNLVIEIGGASQAGSIFYAAPGLNITDAFITAYNQANP